LSLAATSTKNFSSPFALFPNLFQSLLKSSNSASVVFNGIIDAIGCMSLLVAQAGSLQLVAAAGWQG
jgi:hypothetical protein